MQLEHEENVKLGWKKAAIVFLATAAVGWGTMHFGRIATEAALNANPPTAPTRVQQDAVGERLAEIREHAGKTGMNENMQRVLRTVMNVFDGPYRNGLAAHATLAKKEL